MSRKMSVMAEASWSSHACTPEEGVFTSSSRFRSLDRFRKLFILSSMQACTYRCCAASAPACATSSSRASISWANFSQRSSSSANAATALSFASAPSFLRTSCNIGRCEKIVATSKTTWQSRRQCSRSLLGSKEVLANSVSNLFMRSSRPDKNSGLSTVAFGIAPTAFRCFSTRRNAKGTVKTSTGTCQAAWGVASMTTQTTSSSVCRDLCRLGKLLASLPRGVRTAKCLEESKLEDTHCRPCSPFALDLTSCFSMNSSSSRRLDQ
mmetsp:Transcript_28430/g.61799  ORF Transcript_28430/g.61799 Transcript_28430/m.61799 type:complete len:266 (+) Transcript_28430:1512-2309(+)